MKLDTNAMDVIPVILSGGVGSRLWPLSRENYPKPFIKLPDGQNFLQKTFLRAQAVSSASEILTVTNRELYFITQNEYRDLNASLSTSFILEPYGRNTGPSITLAALYLADRYPKDTVILVLPSDHLIEDDVCLTAAVKQAACLAREGYLVTFGIKPNLPETGYGYIEIDSERPLSFGSPEGFCAKRFIEKPDVATALTYMNSSRHFWNSGMFCFTLETILDEMAKLAPDMLNEVKEAIEASQSLQKAATNYFELCDKAFSHVSTISIDYAVMEKSDRVAVITSDFGWHDMGSWEAMSKLIKADEHGNFLIGESILHKTADCYIHSTDRVIGTIGINNLVVIDMPDALLIADRNCAQDVKHVVQSLKDKNNKTVKHHTIVHQPWGYYKLIEEGVGYKIKQILVKPGAALSLQMHRHRSEHWVIMSGTAKVINGDQTFILHAKNSTYIPAGHQHRLENPDLSTNLIIIEIQSGDYLEEDDIVRYEDHYGRVS